MDILVSTGCKIFKLMTTRSCPNYSHPFNLELMIFYSMV